MNRDQRRRLYSPPRGREAFDFDWLETCSIPQSMQFMMDCLPTIQRLVGGYTDPLTVLDVGAASGAGSQLLATMHRGGFFGPPLDVDALGTAHEFRAYANEIFPDIRQYIVSDLFELQRDRKWDLVCSGHAIEHIADPLPFLAELRRRARGWAVLYAPFEEKAPRLPDHEICLTRDFIDSLDPLSVEVIRSIGWRKPGEPDSRCVVFVLKGDGEIQTLRQKAETFWLAGDYAGASDLLRPIVARHPRHPQALYCLAYSLTGSGHPKEAVGHYDRALEAGFEEFWVRFNRGQALLQCGQRQAAISDLARACELRPSDEGAKAALKQARTSDWTLIPRRVSRLLAK